MSEVSLTDSIPNHEMPSRKAILQYLVRMGSFTSAPKVPNEDSADDDVIFPPSASWNDLKVRCEEELGGWPKNLSRSFVNVGPPAFDRIRIMQWNILAQALAEGSDCFVQCPEDALSWTSRRWRLLSEIVANQPDIICLQEVDHYRFFERALSSVGFFGIFCPKPDSPCLYVPGNNGPDGCAIFIQTSRFEVLETKARSLEIWACQTNQVAIFCKLKRRSDEAEFWVATTHLKARYGAFLAALRREQGCDLVDFIKSTAGDSSPIVMAGDMNAGPSEPVHSVLKSANLASVYHNQEPFFTTWTIREDGEHCKTLDYILYRQNSFHVERLLRVPSEDEIGPNRVPSYRYPSDHFALVADLDLQISNN